MFIYSLFVTPIFPLSHTSFFLHLSSLRLIRLLFITPFLYPKLLFTCQQWRSTRSCPNQSRSDYNKKWKETSNPRPGQPSCTRDCSSSFTRESDPWRNRVSSPWTGHEGSGTRAWHCGRKVTVACAHLVRVPPGRSHASSTNTWTWWRSIHLAGSCLGGNYKWHCWDSLEALLNKVLRMNANDTCFSFEEMLRLVCSNGRDGGENVCGMDGSPLDAVAMVDLPVSSFL